MKSFNEVSEFARNYEQIILTIHDDSYTQKLSIVSIEDLSNAIYPLLDMYIGKKHIQKIAEKIAKTIVTSQKSNDIFIIYKDNKKYHIDFSGVPSIIECNEEQYDFEHEIKNIVQDYIHKEELSTFLCEITKIIAKTLSQKNPPPYIPNGFKLIYESILVGRYQIIDQDGNIFTWFPEKTLKNGKQVKGFFVSKYEISKVSNGDIIYPRSISNQNPWVNISRGEATKYAKKIGGRLLSEDECDSIYESILEYSYRSDKDIIEVCGLSLKNLCIWTTENNQRYGIIRNFYDYANTNNAITVDTGKHMKYASVKAENIGFRIVL